MADHINYPELRVLMIGFSRSTGIVGRLIQLFRGGFKALSDPGFPNHAFLVTVDHTQFFATEETFRGLVENSLEKYTRGEKIVAMYRWVGWTPEKEEAAQILLSTIRRKMKADSRYDFLGLLSFVPGLRWFFRPSPERQWCSENCISIHQKFGCPFKSSTLAPDQLLDEVAGRLDFEAFTEFYVPSPAVVELVPEVAGG